METSIHQPDMISKKESCIRDIMKRLPRLIHTSDHYSVLLIHVDTNDTARHDPEEISYDYRFWERGLRSQEHRWLR